MTCNQEILLRLALAVRSLVDGNADEAEHHAAEVLKHLESHGAKPGDVLESCRYEEGGAT